MPPLWRPWLIGPGQSGFRRTPKPVLYATSVGYLRRPPRVTIHHSTSKMVPPPNTMAALHARDAAATHAMPPSTATATSNRPRGNVSSHPRFPTPYPHTPASIHPTSGKRNSRKSISRILNRPRPIAGRKAFHDIVEHSSQPYILWQWMDMRRRA